MKKSAEAMLPIADVALAPVLYPAALLMKVVRRIGVQRLPLCKRALMAVGVFPIRNHYYEPLFDARVLKQPLDQSRDLPGIDWNLTGQLTQLESFHYNDELRGIPNSPADDLSFHFNNGSFESGDAEYWYNLIRSRKPRRIFEIGSGNSTRMARRAIRKNQEEIPENTCRHVCIEPYEMPWLEKTGVVVVRQRVQDLDKSVFGELEKNDILFIDSSHVIRPQGDVLFEYLELLPLLKPGVIVHVHDIFSPRDYLKQWVVDEVKLWNEQYLLEAFLSFNSRFTVQLANYWFCLDHLDEAARLWPRALSPNYGACSFWMKRVA